VLQGLARKMLKKPDLNKPVFRLFPQKAKLVEQGRCVICTKKIKKEDFKDEISKREYGISGNIFITLKKEKFL
jgi:hypothetical protein